MAFKPIHDTQQALGSLQDEMNRLFERVWHGGLSTPPFDGQAWGPPVDMFEYEDRYVAYVEVPGVDGSAIDLTHAGNVLHVRGEKVKPVETEGANDAVRRERRFGAFCRGIDLPEGADAERISAKCNLGVLEITIPKSEACKPKSIRIDVEQQ